MIVYRITYGKVAEKTAEHYERYPGDVEQARRIARYLRGNQVVLPDGAPLTVEAFQWLGQMLGASTGSDDLHYLIEDPFTGGTLSDAFLHAVQHRLSFAEAPLYAVLHEACYAQGGPTRWSAHRVRAEAGGFDPAAALDGDAPLPFTGEMIYPWMFDLDPVLRPLKAAAEILAERDDWPPLYDPARLAANEVPVAAAVYFNDMYVPTELSVPTGRRDRRPAGLGDQRVRARRPACQQRRRARPPDRPRPRHRLTPSRLVRRRVRAGP